MQYARLYRCSLVTMMTYMACSLLALKPPTQILARFEHKSRNEYDLCCQRTLMFLLFLKRNFPPLFSLDSSISARALRGTTTPTVTTSPRDTSSGSASSSSSSPLFLLLSAALGFFFWVELLQPCF